jgi:hypothetical protein
LRRPSAKCPGQRNMGCVTDRGWRGWGRILGKSDRLWLHQKSLNYWSMASSQWTQFKGQAPPRAVRSSLRQHSCWRALPDPAPSHTAASCPLHDEAARCERLLQHRPVSRDQKEPPLQAHLSATVAHQLHENLQITGRLLGDLNVGSITQNILIQPVHVEMRVALVDALRPFPEAARAVAAVLHQLEDKAAADIKADAGRSGITRCAGHSRAMKTQSRPSCSRSS